MNGNQWANQQMLSAQAQDIGYLGIKASKPVTADTIAEDARRRLDELNAIVAKGEAAKPEVAKLEQVLIALGIMGVEGK